MESDDTAVGPRISIVIFSNPRINRFVSMAAEKIQFFTVGVRDQGKRSIDHCGADIRAAVAIVVGERDIGAQPDREYSHRRIGAVCHAVRIFGEHDRICDDIRRADIRIGRVCADIFSDMGCRAHCESSHEQYRDQQHADHGVDMHLYRIVLYID